MTRPLQGVPTVGENDTAMLAIHMLKVKYGHTFRPPPTAAADGSMCAVCGSQHFLDWNPSS